MEQTVEVVNSLRLHEPTLLAGPLASKNLPLCGFFIVDAFSLGN